MLSLLSFPQSFDMDICSSMLNEFWELIFDVFLGIDQELKVLTDDLCDYFMKYSIIFHEFIQGLHKTHQQNTSLTPRHKSVTNQTSMDYNTDEAKILNRKSFESLLLTGPELVDYTIVKNDETKDIGYIDMPMSKLKKKQQERQTVTRSAVLRCNIFGRGSRLTIDLSFYTLAKEIFTLIFCKRVVDEPNLAKLFSIEPCLRCVNPYLRLLSMTKMDNLLYKDKPDCYYVLRVLVSHMNSGIVTIDETVMPLMHKTLSYYVSNPLLYLFLGFSLCQKNGEFIRSDRCNIERLQILTNDQVYTYLLNILSELDGVNFTGEDTMKILVFYLQFIHTHFRHNLDWLERGNISHHTSKHDLEMLDFGGNFDLSETTNKQILEEINHQTQNSKTRSKSSGNIDLSRNRLLKEDSIEELISSKRSISVQRIEKENNLIDMMQRCSLVYYIPNLNLAKDSLLFWINVMNLVISKIAIKNHKEDVLKILSTIVPLKETLENLEEKYEGVYFKCKLGECNFDYQLNSICVKIVLDGETNKDVKERLDILKKFVKPTFSLHFAKSLYTQKDCLQKKRIFSSCCEFLIDECCEIIDSEVKIDIYIYLCNIQLYLLKKKTKNMESQKNIFSAGLSCLEVSDQLSDEKFNIMIDYMIKMSKLIEVIGAQHKRTLILCYLKKIIEQLPSKETFQHNQSQINRNLMKLTLFREIALQSSKIWEWILDQDTGWLSLHQIKDKILSDTFVMHYKQVENIDDLRALALRISSLLHQTGNNQSKLDMVTQRTFAMTRLSFDLDGFQGIEREDYRKGTQGGMSSVKDLSSFSLGGDIENRREDHHDLFVAYEKHLAQIFWAKDRQEWNNVSTFNKGQKIFKSMRIHDFINSFLEIKNKVSSSKETTINGEKGRNIQFQVPSQKIGVQKEPENTDAQLSNKGAKPDSSFSKGLEIDENEEYLFDSLNNSPGDSPQKQLSSKDHEQSQKPLELIPVDPEVQSLEKPKETILTESVKQNLIDTTLGGTATKSSQEKVFVRVTTISDSEKIELSQESSQKNSNELLVGEEQVSLVKSDSNKDETKLTKRQKEYTSPRRIQLTERKQTFTQNNLPLFSDPKDEINGLKHGEEQYLLSLSSSVGLDFCKRKFEVVEKKLEELNLKQKFDWIPEEEEEKKLVHNVKIPEDADSITNRQSTISINYTRKKKESKLSKPTQKITEEPKTDTDSKNPKLNSASFSSTGSASNNLVMMELGFDHEEVLLESNDYDILNSQGKLLSDQYKLDTQLLATYFNIKDKIYGIFNVGLVQADLNRPTDGIILICKKQIYIRTNYMIGAKNRIMNLVAKPNLRNYHRGKWFLKLEDMLQPFEDTTLKNKYRKTKDNMHESYTIRFDELNEVHGKNYLGYPVAIELWCNDRKPKFLVFNNFQKTAVVQKILKIWAQEIAPHLDSEKVSNPELIKGNFVAFLKAPNLEETFPDLKIMKNFDLAIKIKKAWLKGLISNFTYLSMINMLSGRSTVNFTSYSIFPHVITDFKSSPNKMKETRRMDCPIGTYGHDKKMLKIKYESMPVGFHFGVFYSHKNTTEYFLFRLLPFTQQHFNLHLGHMDSRARMFRNMESNFNLCASNFTSELIPELFYLQEYLINQNNLEFYPCTSDEAKHATITEAEIDSVEMPTWSQRDPRFFTTYHRKMLEDLPTRRSLHRWIDLIFGHLQSGPGAVEAFNVFRDVYYPVNTDQEFKLDKRTHSKFTEMFEMGNAPSKMFSEPHTAYSNPRIDNPFFASDQRLVRLLMKPTQIPIAEKKCNISINKAELLTGYEQSYGPIDELLNLIKKREMQNSGSLQVLFGNSILVNQEHIIVPTREGIILSINGKDLSVIYLDCFDITFSHYDFKYGILWIGNSLGEIYGYNKKYQEDKDQSSEWIKYRNSKKEVFEGMKINEANQMYIEFLSYLALNSAKIFTIKDLKNQFYRKTENFDFLSLHNKKKSEKSMSFVLESKTVLRAHIDPICMITSSSNSNLLITADRRMKVCVWDVEDSSLLRKITPPHFAQLDMFNEYVRNGKPPSYLHKELVKLQVPLSISVSKENEDFAIMSRDYISVYTINATPLGVYKRPLHDPKFTCVKIVDNAYSFEDHYMFVGYDNGSVKIFILGKSKAEQTYSHIYGIQYARLSHHLKFPCSVVFECIASICDQDKKRAVKDIQISENQKKILIALEDGELMMGEVSKKQVDGREELIVNYQKNKSQSIETIYDTF